LKSCRKMNALNSTESALIQSSSPSWMYAFSMWVTALQYSSEVGQGAVKPAGQAPFANTALKAVDASPGTSWPAGMRVEKGHAAVCRCESPHLPAQPQPDIDLQ
jgi:hypothetical protein